MSFITQEEALRRLTSSDNLALSALSASSPAKDIDPNPPANSDEPVAEPEPEQQSEVSVQYSDAAAAELNPEAGLILPEIVHEPLHKGRRGAKNIPPMLRAVIGIAARSHSTQQAADAFGISQAQASNLSRGSINGRDIDPELKREVEQGARNVSDVVLDLLLQTMGTISPEKIAGIKSVREAAGVGKDLASIHTLMKDKKEGPTNARVIIMTPTEHSVDAYEIKDVSESPL